MAILNELFNVKDKLAIVTGGSSGIGLTIAKTLCETGAKVGIINRNQEIGEKVAQDLRDKGGEVFQYTCDVSEKESVEKMVGDVEAKIGEIDILVNSAGINIRKPALEFTKEETLQIMNINLAGTFWCCQIVGGKMVNRRRGCIVNISSLLAFIGLENRAPYCASKGGVTQLTKVLAIEWGPFGVRVNAIGPGFFRTPMTPTKSEDESFIERMESIIPLGRWGHTDELRGLLLLLCTDAGSYITGQTICVDGGYGIK